MGTVLDKQSKMNAMGNANYVDNSNVAWNSANDVFNNGGFDPNNNVSILPAVQTKGLLQDLGTVGMGALTGAVGAIGTLAGQSAGNASESIDPNSPIGKAKKSFLDNFLAGFMTSNQITKYKPFIVGGAGFLLLTIIYFVTKKK